MKSQPIRLFSTGAGIMVLVIGMSGLGADIPRSLSANSNGVAVGDSLGKTNSDGSYFAYREPIGKMMGAEALFYAQKLGLRGFNPYVTKTNVNPSALGSLGSVENAMYLYSFLGSDTKPTTNALGVEMFLEPGKLAYIIQKDPFLLIRRTVGNDPVAINKWLSELKNRLTTNSAYQLATQWLRSVDVDVDAMEKKYPPQTTQQFYYDAPGTWKLGESPPPETPKKMLPVFDVSWGGDPDTSPPVWIEIEGINKGLIHLRMEDTRFSRRKPIVVTNLAELLSRPDPPKKQMQLLNNRSNGPAALKGNSAGSQSQRELAATLAMLREVNLLVSQLGLQEIKPLLARHVTAHVFPPQEIELGYLESEKYEYHFEGGDQNPHKSKSGYELYHEPGKLIGLSKRDPFREYTNEQGSYEERFFQLPSLIGTNEAYQLAAQWLANIQVDVVALEKRHKPLSVQMDHDAGKGVRRKGPVFNIIWGEPDDPDPPMSLVVFGPTKELISLAIRDTRFLKREAIRIP